MKQKEFNLVARDVFGNLLAPFGFSSEMSRYARFYRRVSSEVCHFISCNRHRDGDRYDVLVFPSSPIVDPTFDLDFPDNLGVPTDTSPYLSERGINGQQLFNCRYEDNMRRRFEKTVRQLVLTIALPYLDKIQTISDMIPFLKHPYTLGFALHHVGRIEEAKELLVRERVRFAGLDLNDPGVAGVARRIAEILASQDTDGRS